MRVNFIERHFNYKEISIEKLFDFIRVELDKKNIKHSTLKNPYKLTVPGIVKSIIYFHKNQQEINHITGDCHWVCLWMNPKKTILTIHDLTILPNFKGLKKFVYYMLWFYLPVRRMKYITAISQKTKDDLVKLMPWCEKKIVVIPNCTTINNTFDGIKLFGTSPNVLIVGTRSNKNIENVIKALNGLDVQLTIVGELSENQEYLLKENHLKFKNVKFISDEELLDLYRNANILPFVSLVEGFGLPILEAQSQNCAVVTSNLYPMAEVAGDAALLVNPFSVEDIRRGILELINNVELRDQLLQKGKKNIERFRPEMIIEEYVKIYEKINKSNKCY